MDSRAATPELTRAVVNLSTEVRSFERAEVVLRNVLDLEVSGSTIRRLSMQVGQELADLEELDEQTDGKEVLVPEIAAVSCDGGRIRTREPGQGRGVVPSGESGWRETKNASFERMSASPDHTGEDPCPELPSSFRIAAKVADIAETSTPDLEETDAENAPDRVIYEGPHRVLRTAVSSMASSDGFGPMMEREAKRRRLFEADRRAFLGDGLNWNWSIWKRYFPTFTPILDFIHAIQYIFAAAMALGGNDAEGWSHYLRLVTLCWQGCVDAVIAELTTACHDRGINPAAGVGDDHPDKPLVDAIRYLRNNRTRMDYPRYRRMGLPVTSAPMESLIKQINTRVKGTEMFWDDPDGAEAILQLRAAALSEDDRLNDYLTQRPGCAFVRRNTNVAMTAA